MAVLAMRQPPISAPASKPWPVRASVAQALTVVIETPTKGGYDGEGNDQDDFVFHKNSPSA
jgi:hypothetical protein